MSCVIILTVYKFCYIITKTYNTTGGGGLYAGSGMLAIIRCRIFCLPGCYPET
jgi:hypothetical protein